LKNCGAIQKIFQGDTMMTTIGQTMPAGAAIPGLLDRERIIATAGFNRWLVPPAALCIHSASEWPTGFQCSGYRCRGHSA
jgi:hypothetical protein